MATMIHACNCKHDFQDSVYGKGQRVFNARGKGHEHEYKCTVCGSVITDKTTLPKK